MRGLGKTAALALLFVLCIALGVLTVDSLVTRRSPTDVMGSLLIEPPQQHFHKDRIALLLLGIDYNYDDKDQEFSTNARTDTIMAVSINFPTAENPHGSIGLLSVPRDTDYVFPSGREDKINAAYTAGANPVSAAHLSEKAISRFLGIPGFDRFVTLRINAAKELVDAIGGIDVVPDETMNYDDNWGHLHIHFVGGKLYHMNGEQAVSYSRFRHDACSDPCRIKRQQQVMKIVMRKLTNDKLNDLMNVNSLIGVVRRNVITDVSDREALSIASAMRGVDLKAVKMTQVPFLGDKILNCCGDVLIADDDSKRKLVRRIFLDPVVPATPPSAEAIAAVSPKTIAVDVRNGSGVPGAARRMADVLRQKGFTIAAVGNADANTYAATEIHVRASDAVDAHKVRVSIPVKGAVVTPDLADTVKSGRVTVIVGRDFTDATQREASAVR